MEWHAFQEGQREITLHVAFLVMGGQYLSLFLVGGSYKGIVTTRV